MSQEMLILEHIVLQIGLLPILHLEVFPLLSSSIRIKSANDPCNFSYFNLLFIKNKKLKRPFTINSFSLKHPYQALVNIISSFIKAMFSNGMKFESGTVL
jgi:hypothetical protein